jgi:hypothetical protein
MWQSKAEYNAQQIILEGRCCSSVPGSTLCSSGEIGRRRRIYVLFKYILLTTVSCYGKIKEKGKFQNEKAGR